LTAACVFVVGCDQRSESNGWCAGAGSFHDSMT
jgi:hypothetical protein